MRTIEKNIIKAIKDKKTVQLSIRDSVRLDNGLMVYKLWDTDVFSINLDTNIVSFNFGGYGSNTTKSRLNALLGEFVHYGFFQKNWKIYLVNYSNDKKVEIDTTRRYSLINGLLA